MKDLFKSILLKTGLFGPVDFVKRGLSLTFGFFVFLLTDKTPAHSYQSMVYLFCKTGGRFNDLISNLITFFKSPGEYKTVTGVLGKIDRVRLASITQALDEQGYFIFEHDQLGSEVCEEILKVALDAPVMGRELADGSLPKFDRERPKAIRYDLKTEALIQYPVIQDLISDPSLEIVARSYLRARPVMDIITMWWNTAFSPEPSKEAAQYYHFDMDRFKWLKFFFYITDVGPDQGPHSFVSGTQKTGAIPQKLLNQGYVRLEDSEVFESFPSEQFRVFTAPKGFILAEDTRGLHKGKSVLKGDRLVFQLQYSNSLFGSAYQKFYETNIQSSKLKELMKKNKSMFRVFFS